MIGLGFSVDAVLRPVYQCSRRALPGYSLVDTMRTYSFGWQFDGKCGYIELCPESVAQVCPGEGDSILVNVYSTRSTGCWEERISSIEWVTGSRESLEDYHSRASRDPLVSCIPRAMPGHRLKATSPLNAFLISVAQQNASFKQGWKTLYSLYMVFSPTYLLETSGKPMLFLATPRPQALTDIEGLRRTGLGYRARTVFNAVSRGVFLEEPSCDELDEKLGEVRGVGPYTLKLTKLLACRDYRSAPLDRWFTRLASHAYNVHPTRVGDELGYRFGSWAGLAVFHTTIAFDAEPYRKALQRLRRGENCPGLADPSPLTLWKHYRA